MTEKTPMRDQFEAQFIEEYVRVLGEGARELAVHTLAENPPLVSMSWWAWQASRESSDSERLDFLESLARSSYTGASIVKGEAKNSLEVMWFHKRAGAMPSLREAIDSAIAREEH